MRQLKLKQKIVTEQQEKALQECKRRHETKKRKLEELPASKSIAAKRLKLSQPTQLAFDKKTEIFCTMLPGDQMKNVEVFAEQFCNLVTLSAAPKADTLLADRCERASGRQVLLVADHRNPPRSCKTLLALVFGIPIVGVAWVRECHSKLQLASVDKFKFKAPLADLSHLLSEFWFYFPAVSAFSNARLNPTKFSFDALKIIVLRCGGEILHSATQAANRQAGPQAKKILLRVKCNPKFDRSSVDCQLASLAEGDPTGDQREVPEANSDFSEAQIDFRWVTDSVFMGKVAPLSLYVFQ